ncbi:hypothetical protein ON010_g2400 [Phytophthora cinnamomi]|nr:hypothetical protein ON010_g2400 [Phytophthora cinnamomi]
MHTDTKSALKKSTEKATISGMKSSNSRVAITINCLAANLHNALRSGTNVESWAMPANVMANTVRPSRIQKTQLAAQPSDGGRSGKHSSSTITRSEGSGVSTHTNATRTLDEVLQYRSRLTNRSTDVTNTVDSDSVRWPAPGLSLGPGITADAEITIVLTSSVNRESEWEAHVKHRDAALLAAYQQELVDAVAVLTEGGAQFDDDFDTVRSAEGEDLLKRKQKVFEKPTTTETSSSQWKTKSLFVLIACNIGGARGSRDSDGRAKSRRYYDDATALNIACEHGHHVVVVLLVDNGAGIKLDDNAGYSLQLK